MFYSINLSTLTSEKHMKEKVKNGHNFNVDLSLPRKFWLHQSYGLRRPLATSFSISDLNMAFAMFTKLLLGSRLENLFILTHISSEDIVFNSFFVVVVIVFISCVRYLRSGWWLFQTTATRHLHCDSLFPRLPALHQHCYSRTSWGHTGAFALWLRTLHVLQRFFQTNVLSPGVNFFFFSSTDEFLFEISSKTPPQSEATQQQEEPVVS